MSNFLLFFFFLLLSFVGPIYSSDGIQLVIENNCKENIWPAILGTAGQQTLSDGGFSLRSGQQAVVEAPKWWSGRIWARRGCCFDESGKGSCETGDCNGQLNCGGGGGEAPATVVEMTLGTESNPMHYYDVSLVDGFNLAVAMIPVGAGGAGCGVAACEADVNECCPGNLAVVKGGRVVGCKSLCLATGGDEVCCRGEYGSPMRCKPTAYAKLFKEICPRAYSYAYDEASGLKVCRADRYFITFCPPN
ncbi:hypothetical protein ACS0TY_032946 [Phlomoides rotata]